MDDNLTAVLIVFISVVGPLWLVMHYKYKNRAIGSRSAADNAQLAQISEFAQRMEQRVAALERILDAEVPAWRDGNGAEDVFARRAG